MRSPCKCRERNRNSVAAPVTRLDLDLTDVRHFEAAEGWLMLGVPFEANSELEKIRR
jgi:hypothetical protein